MSKNTVRFALPESMRSYISARVSGGYDNASEYIRGLVRKDQTKQAKVRFRAYLEDRLASGPAQALTDADERRLLAIAGVA